MENIKKIDIPKPNSRVINDNVEETETSTLYKNIKAMDILPRDITSIALTKFIFETNEKLEKEINVLKEKNDKILKENGDLKVSKAILKEKIKISFVKDFFNLIMGISGTTFITVSDKVIPKYISAIVFCVSLLIYFILAYCIIKKD